MFKLTFLVATILAMLAVQGVSAADIDTGKAVDIHVNKTRGTDFGIGHVTATKMGNQLKVWGSGRLLRSQYESGHIDIAVMDSTGAKIKAVSVDAKKRAKGSRSTVAQTTLYFTANIPLPETVVSHVAVAFHKDRATGNPETFDCGSNRATAGQGGK
jgi:hypothetical protein